MPLRKWKCYDLYELALGCWQMLAWDTVAIRMILSVIEGLLPLEICPQIQDQLVVRDRSPQQHRSPHSVGSAEQQAIIGCYLD